MFITRTKIIIIIFISAFLLVIFVPGYSKLQKLKGVNQDLTKKIEKLRIENTQLSEEVERLKKDPVYVEEVARKKMGLSKKGEVIYKILGDEKSND